MPNFTIHVVSGPLWALIWPTMLARMSGQKYKALVLAATTQIGVLVSYSGPFIGSLSDKLPDRHARRCGRRRPFIIFGCLLGAGGIALTIDSMYRVISLGKDGTHEQFAWAYAELALSIVIGCVGGLQQ
jgi:MFS family permease